ncbi:MAG: hypothetical protein FIA96_01485 [Betaproteobacteria bacterium]|nr:hypothetical protein [Betaproteobacteria bacterium]
MNTATQESALAGRRRERVRRAWAALAAGLLLSGCNALSGTATLTPDGPLLDANLPRYGLNLGGSGTWGAEQLRANILANPGFEAVLDRTIVIVKAAEGRRIVDDSHWLARPDGFWSGGRYDIRSGTAAGRRGRVLDSQKRADGFAEILLDVNADGIKAGDVVVLTRNADLQAAPGWWLGKDSRIASAPDEARPGSPGRQSLRLMATPGRPAELLHYIDTIGDRAGKLLPVQGKWTLEFWARAASPGARLHVHFDRGGHAVFLDADVALDASWRRHAFEFDGRDDGPPGVLTLGIKASHGEVLLDDAYLGEAVSGAGGFRRAVVDTLKTLQPGVLRDWQGQLGDTLDNRLAATHGHRPARYRPGDNEAQNHYGLPDFFALCAEIGAQPWVVAPTTLDDAEWRQFGAWLREAADRHRFTTVMLEFGNENWNTIFRPGGIPDAATHAAVADRAFRLLHEGSRNDTRIVTVANAQFVNPDSPRAVGARTKEAAGVAVAPYFLYRLDSEASLEDARKAAFEESDALIRQEADTARRQGKRLVVYEENFHTTLGNADAAMRNAVVTNAASGAALARRLLQGTLAGVREQAVYSFAGFDSYLQEGKGLVRLWGITRDLADANRLRPTGIALEMLNRVATGGTRAVTCAGIPCSGLTAVAFDEGRRLAVVSSRPQSVTVSLALPCPQGRLQLAVLDGSDTNPNNENTMQVRPRMEFIDCRDGSASFSIPPYSLAIVLP